jgi:hypothetical protein
MKHGVDELIYRTLQLIVCYALKRNADVWPYVVRTFEPVPHELPKDAQFSTTRGSCGFVII